MPRISELPALAKATTGDVIPIVDDAGNITKKVNANNVVPDGSLATAQISDSAVTTAKIANGAITASKTAFGGNYSLTETNTGFTWVDGKTIYSKTINFGALPNNTTKSVAHAITGLDYVIKYEGMSHRTSDNLRVPIPRTSTTALNLQSSIDIDNTNITIVSATNLSTYNVNYITIYYTKV